MNQLFIAEITRIEYILDTEANISRPAIYAKPKSPTNITIELQVSPPSSLPYDSFGSGERSLPPVGTLALVYYTNDQVKGQIVTYIKSDSILTDGNYYPEPLDENGYMSKIGGITPTIFKLEPNGKITLFGTANSKIKLDASSENLDIYSPNLTQRSAVSLEEHKLQVINDFIQTTYRNTFFTNKYNQEGSDHTSDFDEHYKPVISKNYVDKTIITTGASSRLNGALYQIETRQAILQEKFKDTVYLQRYGLQSDGTFDQHIFKQTYPTVGHTVYISRLGQLLTGDQKGELFREDFRNGGSRKLGNVSKDTMGQGKGYDYVSFNDSGYYKDRYLKSYGKFTDDSIYREYFHFDNSLNTSGKVSGTVFTKVFKNISKIFDESINNKDVGRNISLMLSEGDLIETKKLFNGNTESRSVFTSDGSISFETGTQNSTKSRIYISDDYIQAITDNGYNLLINGSSTGSSSGISLISSDGNKKLSLDDTQAIIKFGDYKVTVTDSSIILTDSTGLATIKIAAGQTTVTGIVNFEGAVRLKAGVTIG